MIRFLGYSIGQTGMAGQGQSRTADGKEKAPHEAGL
tara:strand:- start:1008 stop:1115 length:108 start_codon:yes stop_codon:yes gene_type:complete